MNKSGIELMEKLNQEEFQSLELYELYITTMTIQDCKEMFKFLTRLDSLCYHQKFLEANASALEVRRNTVSEFIIGLCDIIGDKLQAQGNETFVITDDNNIVKLYSSINDEAFIKSKMIRNDYGRYTLPDTYRLISNDWYTLYEYTLT